MRIAVIGGGLFGCTAAIYAVRAGHTVHLYEANLDLMMGASLVNFARLHRGAHYPRSPETGQEGRAAEKSFCHEYGACVIHDGMQIYQIPSEGSYVTADEFADFLKSERIFSRREDNLFYVLEPRINLSYLQAIVRERVRAHGVFIYRNVNNKEYYDFDDFDKIIVATYSSINDVMRIFDRPLQEYKFQVVEKIIGFLPEHLHGKSIVVADGPFGYIDPMDDTPLHLIGHVVHANHATNVGFQAEVPSELLRYINAGTVYVPEISRHNLVVNELAKHIEGLEKSFYIGSQFTVRAVLARQEATDKRPTLVEAVDDKIIKVFSGKLGTTCVAADQVMNLIGH